MSPVMPRRAACLLTACLLAAPAWAGDDAKSFSLGLEARESATLADVGLPGYPGAMPYSEPGGDKAAVTLGAWAGSFGLQVSAMKFRVADSPARVAAFYARALGRHGSVLDCRDAAARARPAKDQPERLRCDEGAPQAGEYEFRVGTGRQFRVVHVRPDGDGARFDVARIAFGS